jgi:hypothetical protein
MALSDFGLRVQNTLYRAGSLLLRCTPANKQFAVFAVNQAGKIITVTGDMRTVLKVGSTVVISGATNINGTYTVASMTYDAGNNRTAITMVETLPGATANGVATATDFVNVGTIRDGSADFEVIETGPDSSGRSTELGLNLSLSAVLQQTSDADLSALDISDELVDVLFTAAIQTGDVKEIDLTAAALNGVVLYGVLVNTSGTLNFNGEQSEIRISIPTRIGKAQLATL